MESQPQNSEFRNNPENFTHAFMAWMDYTIWDDLHGMVTIWETLGMNGLQFMREWWVICIVMNMY